MIKSSLNLFKNNKLDFVFLLIIAVITIVAWHKILDQIIAGEGYYYFSPKTSFILPEGKITNLINNFDNYPKISTFVFESIFKGNIQPYMTGQLLTIILLNMAIFIAVKKITNQPLLAFITAVYFTANYTGNFQLYARGHYQWFLQRVPEFFPILASITFLNKFINYQKFGYYLLALSFFILAIFMTHYTTLFMPFFVSFLVFSALLKTKSLQTAIQFALLAIPFVLINYLIVGSSTLGLDTLHPQQTLLESLTKTKDIVAKVSFQLTVVTIPFSLLNLISKSFDQNLKELVTVLMLPTYILYSSIFFFLYKRKFASLNVVLSCFFGLLGILYLNIYLNRVNVYNEIEQGRYYFIPGFYVGIILASFLINIPLKKNIKYIFVCAFLLCWIIPNIGFTWKKMHDSQRFYTGGRVMMAHLEKTKTGLPEGALVMLPNPLMPSGEDFLKKYYSGAGTKFLYIDPNWKLKLPPNIDPNKIFVYTYNEEYSRGGAARLEFISIVDKSKEYRDSLLQK